MQSTRANSVRVDVIPCTVRSCGDKLAEHPAVAALALGTNPARGVYITART